MRQPAGDGFDIKAEHCHRGRGEADRDDQSRQFWRGAPEQHDHHQRRHRYEGAGEGKTAGNVPERFQLGQEIGRQLALGGQSEEIRDLAGGNDHRDPDGETIDHRLGHVPYQAPGAQQPGDHQDQPGHESGKDQAVIAMIGVHRIDHDNERAGRSADLRPASAKRGNHKAGDDCRDNARAGIGA
ncbi:MAG: hypothetical protein Q8O63_01695 [Hoeflea sp.]|nr:hypothetical protein [Hoeflea sp.]